MKFSIHYIEKILTKKFCCYSNRPTFVHTWPFSLDTFNTLRLFLVVSASTLMHVKEILF